jgi:hypothetical protein
MKGTIHMIAEKPSKRSGWNRCIKFKQIYKQNNYTYCGSGMKKQAKSFQFHHNVILHITGSRCFYEEKSLSGWEWEAWTT